DVALVLAERIQCRGRLHDRRLCLWIVGERTVLEAGAHLILSRTHRLQIGLQRQSRVSLDHAVRDAHRIALLLAKAYAVEYRAHDARALGSDEGGRVA